MGGPVIAARNTLVRSGVTINGLPILAGPDELLNAFGPEALERYFRECIIGGTGAFVLPIRSKQEFASSIKSKLMMEISGRVPPEPPTVLKAQFLLNGPLFSQGGDCAIDELRQWADRAENPSSLVEQSVGRDRSSRLSVAN